MTVEPILNEPRSIPQTISSTAQSNQRGGAPGAIRSSIVPKPAVVPPPVGFPQIRSNLGTCYHCGGVMVPKIREVEYVVGAVGIPVGRNAVIVPNRQVQYAAECPLCGAPLHVPEVEQLNRRMKDDQLVGGLVVLGFLGVIAIVVWVLCAWADAAS